MNNSRRIFYFPAILVFFTGFLVCTISGQNPARPVLAQMDAYIKDLTSLRATVTRVDTDPNVGTTDTQVGKMIYAPNRKEKKPAVRVDFTNPSESFGVSNGKYVIYRPGVNQAWTGPTSGAGNNSGMRGVFSFLGMSREELNRNFNYRYLGKANLKNGELTDHLELTPKLSASYASADIWVNAKGLPVQTRVVQTNRSSTTILLSNYSKNETIAGKEFEIKLKGKVKIIEQE